ncbi:hypothetical protein ACIRSS_46555 [Amycolatopsis sp. NPDC101161]|uniref:hypothetical protein n=1 Tax=Amycolatopsis sp. NPDC101161 TaxID=3363940 RepID=UPI003830B2EF
MAGWESFEVKPFPQRENPFRATVLGGEPWDSGVIRIEPPAMLSQEFLDSPSEYSDAHKLTFWATSEAEGASGTLIRFEGGNVDHDAADNRGMLEETMRDLLDKLGGLASNRYIDGV